MNIVVGGVYIFPAVSTNAYVVKGIVDNHNVLVQEYGSTKACVVFSAKSLYNAVEVDTSKDAFIEV